MMYLSRATTLSCGLEVIVVGEGAKSWRVLWLGVGCQVGAAQGSSRCNAFNDRLWGPELPDCWTHTWLGTGEFMYLPIQGTVPVYPYLYKVVRLDTLFSTTEIQKKLTYIISIL